MISKAGQAMIYITKVMTRLIDLMVDLVIS